MKETFPILKNFHPGKILRTPLPFTMNRSCGEKTILKLNHLPKANSSKKQANSMEG